jgi:hypothetical protein
MSIFWVICIIVFVLTNELVLNCKKLIYLYKLVHIEKEKYLYYQLAINCCIFIVSPIFIKFFFAKIFSFFSLFILITIKIKKINIQTR